GLCGADTARELAREMGSSRMGKLHRTLKILFAAAAIIAAGGIVLGAASSAPSDASGTPDLNGIWQALNEANYDIEAHGARPAMALRQGPYGLLPAAPVLSLGAVGAVPPSLGVVEGGEIPYKPEALARRNRNRQDWLNLD